MKLKTWDSAEGVTATLTDAGDPPGSASAGSVTTALAGAGYTWTGSAWEAA